ncbi:heterokaryon incompatibility, partial [Tricladium varicosporioides]
ISITQNLYDALVHLRRRWTSRELWVDAICINQEDKAEKAAQIPLMGQVYFRARRVVIWLGLPDEQTTQTLALINMIAITAKLETGLRRPMIHNLELEEFDEARHAERRLPSWILGIEKWQALGAFLSKPWFSRVWILQEVILA